VDPPERASLQPDPRFEALVPRFLGVLGGLASRGLLRGTSDAFDFINDFYADAWSGLLERYDPNIGPFDHYAVSSFGRFARTAAVRDHAFRLRFDPNKDLETSASTSFDPGNAIDANRVSLALQRLPDAQRHILRLAFERDMSERALARELGVSRYLAARRLSEALAAIVATMADGGLLSEFEQRLARALFIDGEPLEAAAADAGIPVALARVLRQQLLKRFSLHPRAPS
jgi:RNA polymerase sigma factor (sigma-70 family)